MKKLLSLIFCILSLKSFAQSGENLELLFHWDDESIVGTSWYDNAYNEIWGVVVARAYHLC